LISVQISKFVQGFQELTEYSI